MHDDDVGKITGKYSLKRSVVIYIQTAQSEQV